mmetsp:Transcript_60218/g.171047  ORF Transcript_60218/g.171047 Transcript_60218/m.171047 type:complete len:224 (+) Transcript_60218:130-801(+)
MSNRLPVVASMKGRRPNNSQTSRLTADIVQVKLPLSVPAGGLSLLCEVPPSEVESVVASGFVSPLLAIAPASLRIVSGDVSMTQYTLSATRSADTQLFGGLDEAGMLARDFSQRLWHSTFASLAMPIFSKNLPTVSDGIVRSAARRSAETSPWVKLQPRSTATLAHALGLPTRAAFCLLVISASSGSFNALKLSSRALAVVMLVTRSEATESPITYTLGMPSS